MILLFLALAQVASPFEITDEQFRPYESCVRASARLLIKDTPKEQVFGKAKENCFWEYQSITLDLAGVALEQPGASPSAKPDYTYLRNREDDLHKYVEQCLAEPNASNGVMGC